MVLTESEAVRAQALARRRESIVASKSAETPSEQLTKKVRRPKVSVFDRPFQYGTD
jgi:hypothetical protein